MTGFSALTQNGQALLLLLLYGAAVSQLALFLYRNSHTFRPWVFGADALLQIGLLVLLTMLTECTRNSEKWPVLGSIPAAILALGAVFVLVYAAAGMLWEAAHSKNKLSPDSIKQAMDDLPAGICYADAAGTIVLCNRVMVRLSMMLTGNYPQLLAELNAALQSPAEASGVERLENAPVLHRFPDGRVWRFETVALTDSGLTGFTQTVAQEVTELYESNLRLQADNEQMKQVNEKLRRMYERLADRIREQEALTLKMNIHNNLGSSLIAISEMMNGGADGDMERQIEALKNAVSYFSDDRPAPQGTFDEVRQRAAAMKVRLVLHGYIPQNAKLESLIVAAARECVTNCVNHAKGNRVTVEITEHPGIYTVTITNNGKAPQAPITEGGGLSALRSRVEAAGGEMYISHKPVFTLILNLPEKEREI